jgi:putative iron-dependent peroxidase
MTEPLYRPFTHVRLSVACNCPACRLLAVPVKLPVGDEALQTELPASAACVIPAKSSAHAMRQVTLRNDISPISDKAGLRSFALKRQGMQTPQTGIFALGDAAHGIFEFSLSPGVDQTAALRALISMREPRATVGGANRVLGFRPSLWRKLAPDDVSPDAHDFDRPLQGRDGYTMPATQTDLWAWFSAGSYDTVFDMGLKAVETLVPYATLEREYRGWLYHHNRDLTGFEDGTENPPLDQAPDVALIADGQPGAGGSVVLYQVWKHNKNVFDHLPIAEQEAVIGRTKADSIEFAESQMPADSHVSRTTLDVDGQELDIFRRNVPYGIVSENGTLFIGFSAEQRRLELMLKQMAGVGGPRDALTKYTQPLTGAYYFVPSIQALRRFAPEPD